jgi:hypothetical protein
VHFKYICANLSAGCLWRRYLLWHCQRPFFIWCVASVDIHVSFISMPFSKNYQLSIRGGCNMSLNVPRLSLNCASTGPVVQFYWITEWRCMLQFRVMLNDSFQRNIPSAVKRREVTLSWERRYFQRRLLWYVFIAVINPLQPSGYCMYHQV